MIQSAAATPTDEMSVASGSVFSEESYRHHKKGFSMSDWSSFVRAFNKNRDDPAPRLQAVPAPQRPPPRIQAPTITTTDSDAPKLEVIFHPRCHARRRCRCKLPPNASDFISDVGKVVTLEPGDNYLLLETAVRNNFYS